MEQHLKDKHSWMAAAARAPSNDASQAGPDARVSSEASAPSAQEASVTATQKIETDDAMPPDSPIETTIESPAMQEETQIQTSPVASVAPVASEAPCAQRVPHVRPLQVTRLALLRWG